MKKLCSLLLIFILSLFLFSGCEGLVPSEGEGETQGQETIGTQGVTIDIEGAVEVENKTYLSAGDHTITITFPAPVTGTVKASVTPCSGDYSKDSLLQSTEVVLFPDAARTVWTGSATFGSKYLRDRDKPNGSSCCASYLEITSGSCEDEVCIRKPVIIDCEPPYATIELSLDSCPCNGCELSLASTVSSLECADDKADCGDDCSGISGWSIALFEDYPFDDCCETPCEEPVFTCSGTDCPIECTTDCLTEGTYYVIITLIDHVGNEASFGTQIDFDPDSCDTLILTDLDPNHCLDNPAQSSFTVSSKDAGFGLILATDPVSAGTTDESVEGFYMPGDTITILATPETGYEFANWSAPSGSFADSASASTIFTMPAEDVTVTANFVILDQSGFEVAVPMDDQNAGIAFDIEISNGTDFNGDVLNGNINVVVSSGIEGEVFNGPVTFATGSATIPLNLTTAGEHYFTITITGVTDSQTSLGVTVWYAITFNSNGGSGVDPVTGIANNATITLPANPTLTSYTFAGWFTDDGTFLDPFTGSTPVTASITVYAKWMTNLNINWNFEDASKRGVVELSSNISQYIPDEGSGTIGLIGADFGNFTNGSGGSGTHAAHSNNWNDGAGSKYWQITVSTTGYENLKISSKQRSSGTGPRDFKFQYSTDGSTWNDFSPVETITVANNFTSGVLDEVSLPIACENQGTLYLRWIMTSDVSVNAGTIGISGTNRIDDILLTGDAII